MTDSVSIVLTLCHFLLEPWVRVFAIANPSVVCLSSVTFVRPQGVETFGNISPLYFNHSLTFVQKFFGDRLRGIPSSGALIARGVPKILVRPPDIVVGGLIFYQGFFFFFRQLPAELAERNSTTFGHIVGSKCNLKMHAEIWGIPSPYKLVAKNHLF